jgi:hypothetical protein
MIISDDSTDIPVKKRKNKKTNTQQKTKNKTIKSIENTKHPEQHDELQTFLTQLIPFLMNQSCKKSKVVIIMQDSEISQDIVPNHTEKYYQSLADQQKKKSNKANLQLLNNKLPEKSKKSKKPKLRLITN